MIPLSAWLLLLCAADAPITRVTVHPDRARIERTMRLELHGIELVDLPLLPGTADPGSIRVEAAGAEVLAVTLHPAGQADLPPAEGRKLVRDLDELDSQLAQAHAAADARDEQKQMLESVRPARFEVSDRPVILDPSSWRRARAFLESRLEEVQRGRREALVRIASLEEQRSALVERAHQLLKTYAERIRVRVRLRGSGPARAVLSYEVRSARWSGEYAVQYVPGSDRLLLSYAALVSQGSGEDWIGQRLNVSTARPGRFEPAPELLAWRLTDARRFVPTPTPLVVSREAAPPAPPLPAHVAEDALLRRRLERRAPPENPMVIDVGSSIAGASGLSGANRSFDSLATDAPPGTSVLVGVVLDAATRAPIPDVVVTAHSPAMQGEQVVVTDRVGLYRIPGLPPGAYVLRFEKESYRPYSRNVVDLPAGRVLRLNVELLPETAGSSTIAVIGAPPEDLGPIGRSLGLLPPQSFVGFAPGTGPDGDADGPDMSFASSRPESIHTGNGATRVTLVSEQWPVTIRRRAYPALSQHVYLVGRTRNPSSRVLPAGTALLSVGSDPSGHAHLPILRPGDEVELPLGIDHDIRPIRNVSLRNSSRGLFSKDDLSEVKVTVEVANPRPEIVPLEILEQLPVRKGEHIEVEVLEVTPAAKRGDEGGLEWDLRVPARGKAVLSYRYRLVRPRGWELRQSEGEPR